jgi:Ca2+/H+ antiporter, TMEM165/GDT1 family
VHTGPVESVLVAFVLVFVAELGDKTQIVAFGLGTRYPRPVVLVGITIAYATTQAIAVVVGAALGAALPTRTVTVAAGVLFLGFALWTLRDRDNDGEAAAVAGRGTLLGVIGAMVLAELGDKSMLAGAALAADRGALPVWIGATLGETTAGALAVLVGGVLGARIPERATRLVAAALFAAFGVALLIEAA